MKLNQTEIYLNNEFTIVIWFKLYSNSNISLIDFSKNNFGNIGIRIENLKIIVWSKKENNNKTINEFKSDTIISNDESKWTHLALRSCIY